MYELIYYVGNLLSLAQDRKNLPIFEHRRTLINELRALDSVVIIGETGSGKTTQIPQYLFESSLHRNHLIACTQPRRVAAVTVAERVAKERNVQLGERVGYCVRFDDMTSPNTKIKFMTDGMLLREAILDPLLKRYSVVILDEAHERTIHTDVLFGVVKAAQKQRNFRGIMPLKIIVMSATMDAKQFSNYFNGAKVIYLQGRLFPVKVLCVTSPQSDYLEATLTNVFQVHKQAPANHDILVFLTGQEEIESIVRTIRSLSDCDLLPKNLPPMIVYPLYAALPQNKQLQAFQPTPKGFRKVIVATNIAETSVTISGIKFVIDSGMVKTRTFNAGSGLDVMKVQRISQAQAWQRTGRAGRESPGTSYRLYTEEECEAMDVNTKPEILRCNLSSVVLQLLAMGITNVMTFDFMDKPSQESLESAMKQLQLLGAVDKENKNQLTPQGRQMAAFPLDPRLAKVILMAKDYNCLEEILTIVSLLSVESVLQTPQNKKEAAHAARKKYVSNEGDHLTFLNIFRAYKSFKASKGWCHDNFVNARNMKTVVDVRKQLREICQRLDLPFRTAGHDTTPIRKCLAAGFFMNAAELQKQGEYLTMPGRKTVAIHPSSTLFMCKPACVIYTELVKTTKCYMRDLCLVDPEWLIEVAPSYFKQHKIAR